MLPLREKVATNEDAINLKHVSVAVPALLLEMTWQPPAA